MATTDRRGVSVNATDTPIAGDPNPGLAIKAPVLVATTANITLSGAQTVDGVSVGNNNERVLVWQQTDATTNGLYNASSSGWTRAIDADGNDDFAQGMLVEVTQGTVNGGTLFRMSSADPTTLGTTAITFVVSSVTATRNINTTAPLAGGGNLAVDRTLSLVINGSLQVTGGALAVAQSNAVAHQWVSSFSAAGVPQYSQPGVADIANGAALTNVNDTNVTIAVSGGGAAALLAATSLTVGWTGTLAAGRLNSSVVQGVTNDTNIQGSISAQNLTFSWAGQLSPARGGTGVNNGSSTITLGGNLTHAGAFATTITVTATTNSTLPAGTHTLGGLDVTQTWSAPQTYSSQILLGGVISPTALSADQNDYNPTGLSGANVIRQDGGGANRNITGLLAQTAGALVAFESIGANSIILKNASASSAAANRFLFGADITLAPNQTALLWYDGTSANWRCLGVFTSSGGGSGTVTSITIGNGLASTQSPLTTSGTLSVDPSFFPNFIGGLVLSNDGTTPNSVLDIASGVACDSTNAAMIKIGAFTKSTAGAWTSGSGNNGMGNGLTVAASTWYHVILANNGGTPDIYFDTSVTGANRPAGISDTKVRRIGSFKTDASSHIVTFFQNGDDFLWNAMPALDVNTTNPGTSAVTATLGGVPSGIRVKALLNVLLNNAGPLSAEFLFSSLDIADTAPSETASPLASGGNDPGASSLITASQVVVWTNTSAQVRYRLIGSAAGTVIRVQAVGWTDPRGK